MEKTIEFCILNYEFLGEWRKSHDKSNSKPDIEHWTYIVHCTYVSCGRKRMSHLWWCITIHSIMIRNTNCHSRFTNPHGSMSTAVFGENCNPNVSVEVVQNFHIFVVLDIGAECRVARPEGRSSWSSKYKFFSFSYLSE